MEQVHPVPLALAGVKPRGSVSFMVTTPTVGPYKLTFCTGTVKEAAVPRTNVPTCVFCSVRSGVHAAPDCTPVTCWRVAVVALVPAEPGVAP